jgi:hypothetical protein
MLFRFLQRIGSILAICRGGLKVVYFLEGGSEILHHVIRFTALCAGITGEHNRLVGRQVLYLFLQSVSGNVDSGFEVPFSYSSASRTSTRKMLSGFSSTIFLNTGNSMLPSS